jgi:hypothetical protein
MFMRRVSIIPSPPRLFGLHIADQRTQWYLRFVLLASQ